MAAERPRRTQAERSAAMQRTLVDAAIDLLVERGWAATTAVAVCERAGCTRGALMHHYPSLSALLAHALETVGDDFLTLAEPELTGVVDGLDRMWTALSDRRFKAVLEAWSAAANDPELAHEITPAIARFASVMSIDSLRRGRVADPEVDAFVLTAREAMIGLALGRANNAGAPLGHERIVLDRLIAEAATIDAGRPDID